MAADDLEIFLSDEALRVEQFSTEIRARMRELMHEIEDEFRQFIDRMLGEQAARLEAEAATLSPQGTAPPFGETLGSGLGNVLDNVFQPDAGSLVGSALGAAFNAALGGYLRGGGLKPRSIANAGGRVLATQIGTPSFRTQPDSPRLSRTQIGDGLLKELTRAQRNS